MKKIILICVVCFFVVSFGICFLQYNSFTKQVNDIEAVFNNNKQIYSNIRVKIEQSGLIANEYSDQVIRAIQEAMINRYGGGGVKGAMLWIKEENPTISSDVYLKIQQIVDIEYSRFEANQTTLIDKVRIYKNSITTLPGKFFALLFNFSMEDIKDYNIVLNTQQAQQDFSSGIMTVPNTFGKKN